MMKRLVQLFLLFSIITASCAYYNTFYNAEEAYKKAAEERRERLKKQGKTRELWTTIGIFVPADGGNAVFWAFHKRDLFYTGISDLFSQPEFQKPGLIYDVSAVIDRMDEVIDSIFDEISDDTTIRIGSANAFSSTCTSIIHKYKKNGK